MTDNKHLNVSNCLIGLQHPLFAQHCTAQYSQTLPKTWRHTLSGIKPGNSNKLCRLLIFPLLHFSDYQSLIWRWCILHAQKASLEMEACSRNWICLTDVTQRDNEYAVDRCLCYVHTHIRKQGHRFPVMENRESCSLELSSELLQICFI